MFRYLWILLLTVLLCGCGRNTYVSLDSDHNYILQDTLYVRDDEVLQDNTGAGEAILTSVGYTRDEDIAVLGENQYITYTKNKTVLNGSTSYMFLIYDVNKACFVYNNEKIDSTQVELEWQSCYVTFPESVYATNGRKITDNTVLFNSTESLARGCVVFNKNTYLSNKINWGGLVDNATYDKNVTFDISADNAVTSFKINDKEQENNQLKTTEDGTYTLSVELINGYKETKTITVDTKIKPVPKVPDKIIMHIGDASLKIATKNIGSDVVWESMDKKIVTVSQKGKITPISIGYTKVIAIGSNGSTLTNVYILPKKIKLNSVKGNKRAITIKYKADKEYDKLQVQLYTNRKLNKGKKSFTVKDLSFNNFTVNKLKSKKKYYVRIRGIKIINNKKIYSSWSAVKSVKTK